MTPAITVTYALLTAAIVALWTPARPSAAEAGGRDRIWPGLFLGALLAALFSQVVQPAGLLWIGAFGAAAFACGQPGGSARLHRAALVALPVLAAGLMTHQLPGFQNPRVLDGIRFSADALPFRLHLNFDKTAAGLLLLGFCHPRMTRGSEWRAMAVRGAPVAAATVGAVLVLSLAVGYVRFEPKLPAETALWLWVNLCFTCLAEEAVFRGFIQRGLARAWRTTPRGEFLALAAAALLFGLAHAGGGPAYVALSTVAGLGYGWAYQRTGRIEASILAHFSLNTVHFLLFTYPALPRG